MTEIWIDYLNALDVQQLKLSDDEILQAVEAALRAAPGLDALSAADRQALKDALVSGACVTTALESVFDDVPILALRNLIRDLNSGC